MGLAPSRRLGFPGISCASGACPDFFRTSTRNRRVGARALLAVTWDQRCPLDLPNLGLIAAHKSID